MGAAEMCDAMVEVMQVDRRKTNRFAIGLNARMACFTLR